MTRRWRSPFRYGINGAALNRPGFLAPQRFVAVFILLFAGTVVIHSASRPLADWDELVYLHLSERMTWTGGSYTTSGSFIEERLPQPVYRSPVFHHPPLVPFVIKLLSVGFPPIVAARLMNGVLYVLLLWLAFSVTQRLSGDLGGAIAMGLVAVCPIFHLEARLVHLDLPMTVFLLLGVFLCLPVEGRSVGHGRLVLAGTAFAAAFLCKLTGPMFFAIPAVLYASDPERRRRVFPAVLFLAVASLGFSWWVYVVYRFGSLVPAAFVGEDATIAAPFTEYLQSLARREWYHLPLYFLAICPLFGLYIAELPRRAVPSFGGRSEAVRSDVTLVLLNAGTWVSAVAFGYANSRGNGYWVFRHFLPIVAIVYVTLGCMLHRLLLRGSRVWSPYLIALMAFTALVMTWSTATSADLAGNIKPVPVLLFWIGLGHLFH